MATSLFKIKTDPIQAMSRHVTSSDFRTPLSLSISVSLHIQPEFGKMWTRITRNTDTFYAVG